MPNKKYLNPYISYDGLYWYLSVSYEIENIDDIVLTNESIGIDVGIKELAVLYNEKIYHNINKSRKIKKLEKKLRREQRKFYRKLKSNKSIKRDLDNCRNLYKQRRKVRSIYKKLTDIRTNYLHQTTTAIVKTKPSKIVVENLNIKGMMKNHNLAKYIMDQKLYEFRKQLEYKSELYGIKFILANHFYPSSKLCSNCGNKQKLKLSDRTYKCLICGLVIDRDLNAAINLAKL